MKAQNTQTFNSDDFAQWPGRYRANLLNKVSGFKSAHLVGTANPQGQHNLAMFNSIVHVGANPPYIGFVLRPRTVPRHTFSNILETKYYTLNQVHQGIFKQAHQTSAKYDQGISEFSATGLTPGFWEDFYAPFVKESHIKMGLEFEEYHEIKANDTLFVVGKLVMLSLPSDVVNEDGHLDLASLNTVAIGGLDSYYQTSLLETLPYAQP